MARLGFFFTAAAALLLAGTSQALRVPQGLADGVYSIAFDDAGVATSEPVLLGSISARTSRPLQQRVPQNQLPMAQTRCTNSGTILPDDFNLAMADFQDFCDTGVPSQANSAVVYTKGDMIAYMCTYEASNRCWRAEYTLAVGYIVAACGNYRGGEVFVQQYSKSYGGNSVDQDICIH